MDELMNRSKVVVSRSGYTTVLDLVEIDVNGVFVPTPNQTEQEYLGDYLGKKGYFLCFPNQDKFTLKGTGDKLKKVKMFKPPWKTAQSVKKIEKTIMSYL